MKRIDLELPQSSPHFIGSWSIEPLSICDEVINFFETHSTNHTKGRTAGGLNTDSKNSTDLAIRPRDLDLPGHEPLQNYIESLFDCYKDYLEQWPFLKSVLPNAEVGSFNIQKYEPGGHFLKVHSERTTIDTSHRVLAWMTYLNDVEDGGATRFEHQDFESQPHKGKTLIWPGEWTHAHRGNVVNSGVKYIITGWMHFPPYS